MKFNRGDIVSIKPENINMKQDVAVIIQADWFNDGQPPSYIVNSLTSQIYPELDFRPVITPDNQNNLSQQLQITIDKPLTISSKNIEKKIGRINKKQMSSINGCLRAILNL